MTFLPLTSMTAFQQSPLIAFHINDNISNTKVNFVGSSSNEPPCQPLRVDKWKAPMVDGGSDKEGFIPMKLQGKGRGQKHTLKDRQDEGLFNHFAALEGFEQIDGMTIEMQDAKGPVGEDHEASRGFRILDNSQLALPKSQMDTEQVMEASSDVEITNNVRVGAESALVCANHMPKMWDRDPEKTIRVPPTLGIHQKNFKKGGQEKGPTSGTKN